MTAITSADDKTPPLPWKIYALVVLASVVFCGSLFTGTDQWGRGDWDQFSFRYATPRVAMLRDLQLPLWNPYVNGGTVLLAHPHCPAFSPWYLPTLILGAPLGLRFQVLLFVALGATGMATLLRRWGVSAAGCFVGGVLLMMSAHFAMHVTEGHLEWCLLGLMPWVLLCLLRAQHDWRFVIVGALVLASALLHGSIYIVVVFVPLLVLWAILESIRTRSPRAASSCAAMMVLTFLLGAVVLFPRLEFLRANPRSTELHEQVSPAALGWMLLEPDQAALFRHTRDVRNPPDRVLSRILPARYSGLHDALTWHRLDVVLVTTSDWADVHFEGFDYILVHGPPQQTGRTLARLNSMPLSTDQWLAVKNPGARQPKVTLRATLYVRLPRQGGLDFVVTRGNFGGARLMVYGGEDVLLDAMHTVLVPGDLKNRRVYSISPDVILARDRPAESSLAGPWYELQATLKTSADWCDVQVINTPYLSRIDEPRTQRQAGVRPSMSSLGTGSRQPGETETTLRAALYFQCPENDDLRIATIQGSLGTSRLILKTPGGDLLETVCNEVTEPGGEVTHEYVLANGLIRRELEPLPQPPLRWQLDEMGMIYDWHEYGLYLTWIGLAAVVCGLVVSIRRQWPLIVVGTVAALLAFGAALPVSLWGLLKLAPMYGSLQVPSRFLVAVVFVAAICGGYGIDRFGCWGERIGGRWLRRAVQCGAAAVIYIELAVLGWNLFGDVFVCPPAPVPAHDRFAQRYRADEVRCAAMYGAHYPYLLSNSGVIKHYENIAVKPGKVRVTSDPDYRGEVYLEGPRGEAEIAQWTMARVIVDLQGLDAPDRLVLNQNYFPGWKAIRHGPSGTVTRSLAQSNSDGLVSVAVDPADRQVEFYYLPDSFVAGAIVSGLTLLICLGLLLSRVDRSWRSWKLTAQIVRAARRCAAGLRSPAGMYLMSAVALNIPLLVCHPRWTLLDVPLVRSLAIAAVLFLIPGLPLVGLMIGRGWLRRPGLLWVMTASLGVFLAMLTVAHLAGLAGGGRIIWLWNATWIVTNVAVLLNVILGGPPAWAIRLQGAPAWIGVLLFAIAYLAFFHGATHVVPVMEDHDYETQGTAPGLLRHLEMRLLTDRHTAYCFAHPPLVHVYVAGSFLYYGQLGALQAYEDAWDRVSRAEQGHPVEPAVTEFYHVPDQRRLVRRNEEGKAGATLHRIVGQEGKYYLVQPPLPQQGDWRLGNRAVEDRIRVRDLEVQILYDDFRRNPHRLATRTPNVFLAALTVGLMGWWITRMTGHAWFGLLVSLAYATSPEVFVRSCYGGYFAISNFALLQILLAVESWTKDRSWAVWRNCLLAGAFAALANHKLVLLPMAVVTWEVIRLGRDGKPTRAARALFGPVMIGFAAGTALFWAYGLAVSPSGFVQEHLHHHLVDRVLHHNPLGYVGYPGAVELWAELWRHTGYVLLPLGLAALGWLCCRRDVADAVRSDRPSVGLFGTSGLWAVWVLLGALAFTVIDWRQTKHLMPILLPMHLAPARWAATGRPALLGVSVVFAALLIWNLDVLRTLAADFRTFRITPAW